ncbi:Variant surface glycoprotein [Trypanosoma congolense IL3000]|uniref:Variant surface glycoprotein n=1 Tax=Trypanosoma congolense (strain IL3000) TaxID=1068625 RepID=F9WGT2_TRYCI|nr:Variant surface glycoprotein [Trypanosoma congolense IL3000]
MKFWMMVMFVIGAGANSSGTDHNGEEHKALCNLLKVAVWRWGTSGEGLSQPLRAALGRTIFGDPDGGSLETWGSKVPEDYDVVEKIHSSRSFLCGFPKEGGRYKRFKQVRWPGHSAPHDLVCLCTTGEGGYPVNGARDSSPVATLCEKTKEALGGGTKGWSNTEGEEEVGKAQIGKTWEVIVTECLKKGEKAGDLKSSLQEFKGKLVEKRHNAYEKQVRENMEHELVTLYTNRYQLGEGIPTEEDACSGSPPLGVCVMYYNATKIKEYTPWWSELEKALLLEEEEERKARSENEVDKDKKQKLKVPDAPRPTNQSQTPNTENSTAIFSILNMTSGTPITPPCSWLLSATILI